MAITYQLIENQYF